MYDKNEIWSQEYYVVLYQNVKKINRLNEPVNMQSEFHDPLKLDKKYIVKIVLRFLANFIANVYCKSPLISVSCKYRTESLR